MEDSINFDDLAAAVSSASKSEAKRYGEYSSRWGKVYRGENPVFIFQDGTIFPTRHTLDLEREYVENSSAEELGIEEEPEEEEPIPPGDAEDPEELPEEPPPPSFLDDEEEDEEEDVDVEEPSKELPVLELNERIRRFLDSVG